MLELAWQCERYHSLPDTGGVLDQDYSLMREMTASVNVHNIVKRTRTMSGKQIHSLSESDRSIIKYLMDEGIWQT